MRKASQATSTSSAWNSMASADQRRALLLCEAMRAGPPEISAPSAHSNSDEQTGQVSHGHAVNSVVSTVKLCTMQFRSRSRSDITRFAFLKTHKKRPWAHTVYIHRPREIYFRIWLESILFQFTFHPKFDTDTCKFFILGVSFYFASFFSSCEWINLPLLLFIMLDPAPNSHGHRLYSISNRAPLKKIMGLQLWYIFLSD